MTPLVDSNLLFAGNIGNNGDALYYRGRTQSPLVQRRSGTWGTTAIRSFLRPQVPVPQVPCGDAANPCECRPVPALPLVPDIGERLAQ